MSNSSTKATDGTSRVYDRAASFGKVMANIGAVVMTIVYIIVVVYGIRVIRDKNPKLSTDGTITSVDCNQAIYDRNNMGYSCSFTIDFTANGKAYTINISNQREDHTYSVGQTIKVYYNPTNPTDATLDAPLDKNGAKLMIGVATGLLLLCWLWVWAVHRFQFLAAMQGVDSGLRLFGR